ncbi:hypothetical protein ASPSYDRAFT_30526 [Aspergillus sydowii CBS 593.65]|uniref:Uncharacterized protein n=1 Tax=Aspergillus sydowii CBS 593.65 TaxID=1036612 RepID=A0A1L9TJR4_9EURO|nr:uncharacterized protein ASPSYDRAFT_30526 [Aspergillus sydowii CBS 593.65]OJJ59674.1 hypothetical protein ASPSYDRAFT_30526 [Aspergillus sydowii CBS 593.65]
MWLGWSVIIGYALPLSNFCKIGQVTGSEVTGDWNHGYVSSAANRSRSDPDIENENETELQKIKRGRDGSLKPSTRRQPVIASATDGAITEPVEAIKHQSVANPKIWRKENDSQDLTLPAISPYGVMTGNPTRFNESQCVHLRLRLRVRPLQDGRDW